MYSCNFLTQKITKTPPNHLYFSLPVILLMFRRQRCPMSNCSKPKLLQKSRKHIQPLRGAQRHERTIQKYKNSVPGCTFIVHEMSAYCLFVVSALSLLMILFVFFPLLCCHLDSFGSQGSALVYFPYSTAGLGLDEANTIQNQISTKNQARCCRICRVDRTLGPQTKVHHEDFTITEKPLKVTTIALPHLGHYAKQIPKHSIVGFNTC